MTVLTAEQVAAAAYIGGFRNSEIVEAVATAFGESSFNTKASNFCCYGLWQINKSAHQQLFASGDWTNPADNAKMAYQIYREAGGNWGPWQAHGAGQYKLALPKARTALQQLTADLKSGKTPEQILGSKSTDGSNDTQVSPVGITDSVKALTDPHNWVRVGLVLVGMTVLMWGLVILSKDNKTVRALVNAGINAIPEGKAAKVAMAARSAKSVKTSVSESVKVGKG